jgi:hypothetical protein
MNSIDQRRPNVAVHRLGAAVIMLALGLGSSPCWAQSSTTTQATPQALAGHYYLEGVREVGAELRLMPSGRFA